MHDDRKYLFTSARLGFRNWLPTDIDTMAAMNADKEVMQFFPKVQTLEETQAFITRMQMQYVEKGFCYFAVDSLADSQFIGFIGLSEKNFEADFTPCIDIGWRLSRNQWYKGYATEGAKACLDYAFNHLDLTDVFSIAPQINTPSVKVMEQLGMKKVQHFKHPQLTGNTELQDCVVYKISKA